MSSSGAGLASCLSRSRADRLWTSTMLFIHSSSFRYGRLMCSAVLAREQSLFKSEEGLQLHTGACGIRWATNIMFLRRFVGWRCVPLAVCTICAWAPQGTDSANSMLNFCLPTRCNLLKGIRMTLDTDVPKEIYCPHHVHNGCRLADLQAVPSFS